MRDLLGLAAIILGAAILLRAAYRYLQGRGWILFGSRPTDGKLREFNASLQAGGEIFGRSIEGKALTYGLIFLIHPVINSMILNAQDWVLNLICGGLLLGGLVYTIRVKSIHWKLIAMIEVVQLALTFYALLQDYLRA